MTQAINSFSEILDKYDMFILDQWGVMHDGNRGYEHAIEAVNNLRHDITIIMIAHRLSTVRDCDVIYFLESGQIRAQGTYAYLQEVNETFRAMSAR